MLDVKCKISSFEKDVVAYEAQEIQEGLILFYGDSGFTRWSERHGNPNLSDVIRRKDGSPAAVCHGLGGSTIDQLLYRYPRMVRPWKPRALVLKVYNNDRDVNYSPDEIIFLQSRLLEWARTDFPGIKLYVCDAQPLLLDKDRKNTWYYHQLEYNELLEHYCSKHEDTTMVWQSRNPDLYLNPEDIGDYTKIREDLFIEDQVHFNAQGYEIYKNFWLKQLDDIL
jgi:hypothetical protein